MKWKLEIRKRLARTLALSVLVLTLGGCGHKEAEHEHERGERAENTVSLYEKNRGLRLPEEVRATLGVTLIEVATQANETNASDAAALAIPGSALIEGVQSDFVYVESGDHFVRTDVVPGASRDGWIQISEGLLPGDKVVAKGAHDLWMIELLALRGGSPCCPVPKKGPKS